MQTIQQTTAAVPVPMVAPVARRFVTINECAHLRPFTAAALRDLRFKSADRLNSRGDVIKGNGSDGFGVWATIGRKVLIDLDALDRWIESHKGARQ